MDVEIVFVVNAIAMLVKIQRSRFLVNSVSVTTSHVIATIQSYARVQSAVHAIVELVGVSMDGQEMLVNAVALKHPACHLMVWNARTTANVIAVNASAIQHQTLDTQESTARSAQHAVTDVRNSSIASSVKCTRRDL